MDSRRFRSLFSASLLVIDLGMLTLGFVLAHRLRLQVPWPAKAADVDGLAAYGGVLAIFLLANITVMFSMRMYHLVRATSRVDEFYTIFGGITLGTLLAVALASLTLKNSVFEVNLPRAMLIYAWISCVLLVMIGRVILQRLRATLQAQGFVQDKVVIVGTGEVAQLVVQKIHSSPYLGYHILGVVRGPEGPDTLAGLPLLGGTDDMPRLIDELAIDEVIIAIPEADDEVMVQIISLCQRDRVNIKVFPDVFELMATGVTIDDLGGLPLLNVRDVALRGWRLTFKRAMDLVGSSLILVLTSPMLVLLAVLIKLDSRGPVFFVQERAGLDAKPFPMIKFRSMKIDAEVGGPGWTVKGDPRVTRLGRFIRKYSLDEFPNFINVLLGDMSLVGPRPEQPTFVDQFRKQVPRYMERHREKAGVTGWAQVNGLRGDTSIMERTKYDLWYIENWSIWLDIKIILRTVFRMFFDRNAY